MMIMNDKILLISTSAALIHVEIDLNLSSKEPVQNALTTNVNKWVHI